MAPELLDDGSLHTRASAVHALGWVLWEMLAKKVPYHHIHDLSLVENKIRNGEQGEIPKDAPEKYIDMIQACWAIDPRERPSVKKLKSMLSLNIEKTT